MASMAEIAAASRCLRFADFVDNKADAVDFHRWLQWQLDEQLCRAQ
ncbi:4-alpha-glucanotransferase [Mycobacterium tuberculosis CAS/NITR204]|uniref:4-alpha-glucanotransferase n=1 Tax=Mycobacterium tuberculosis CAS/NITR204 TaxID=1310114 RepID=R4MH17_MYCTX|nr:4-alpha-glucanotransferase [Mycobacterium tuberculosis CAS/NITR204]